MKTLTNVVIDDFNSHAINVTFSLDDVEHFATLSIGSHTFKIVDESFAHEFGVEKAFGYEFDATLYLTYLEDSEGVETMIEKMAPVSDVLNVYAAGIRSGFSYSGAHNIKDLWAKASWHEQSFSGHFEGTPHILAKK